MTTSAQLNKYKKFQADCITHEDLMSMQRLAQKIRLNAAQMINQAGTGHIGGACSSIDIYLAAWLCSNISPCLITSQHRDRIIVSHGHTSAGIYSVLGNLGYFSLDEAMESYRKYGSIFEGHPSIEVPGVEWSNGILGQGLSQACGSALAAKIMELDYHVLCVMGDGEQAKGQLQEAREFAAKYRLNNIIAIVDCNDLQASGCIDDVMPQNIKGKYASSGWRTIEVNGHDFQELYRALRAAYQEKDRPVVVLAHTIMGKGFAEIEGNFLYHGTLMSPQALKKADQDIPPNCSYMYITENNCTARKNNDLMIKTGIPRNYHVNTNIDLRSAVGHTLLDIAEANKDNKNTGIVAFDCDLASSVKLKEFAENFPHQFIECGIAEHNAVTTASAISREGLTAFLCTFAVFGIDEPYSQHRVADINHSQLKMICTHCGLDVGEDGKTHQCIDYLSLLSNLQGMKVVIPADANQADRAVRFAAAVPGSVAVLMGRSKMSVIANGEGEAYFSGETGYAFEYGKADWLCEGKDGVIITYGNLVCRALSAAQKVRAQGRQIGVLNVSCPLELDMQAIQQASETGLVVVYEDHNINSGLGNLIAAALMEQGLPCKFKKMGVKGFGVSAPPDELYRSQALDVDSLVACINNIL